MIGRNGERRSGISAQAARHDDDDDDIYICRLVADWYDTKSNVKLGGFQSPA